MSTHTVHVVVSSSGTSSTSAPEAWVSSSSAPASSVEVPSSVGPSSHGVVSPVVAVVSAALARWRPHHAWASACIEGRSVVVRGRWVIEAGTTGRVVGRVATVHGHLHVHVHVVHVVHVVHPWTVPQQTLVDWTQKELMSDIRTE